MTDRHGYGIKWDEIFDYLINDTVYSKKKQKIICLS